MRNVIAATSRAPTSGTSSGMSASVYGRNFSRVVWIWGIIIVLQCVFFNVSKGARERHACQSCAEAKNVIREDVREHQSPLAVLEVRHALESIAGKSCERTAEAYDYEQSPTRIY